MPPAVKHEPSIRTIQSDSNFLLALREVFAPNASARDRCLATVIRTLARLARLAPRPEGPGTEEDTEILLAVSIVLHSQWRARQ